EQVPVGVGDVRAGRMDLVAVRGEHRGEQVGADLGVIHLAAQVHRGAQRAGLGVVGELDGVDEDIVDVPVGGVLGQHALHLRLKGGKVEGAAVEQGLGAGAKAVAALGEEI